MAVMRFLKRFVRLLIEMLRGLEQLLVLQADETFGRSSDEIREYLIGFKRVTRTVDAMIDDGFIGVVENILRELEFLKIDRSAFFVPVEVKEENITRVKLLLKAKNVPNFTFLGEDSEIKTAYDEEPHEDEQLPANIFWERSAVLARPTQGVGWDAFIVIRDDSTLLGVIALDDTSSARAFTNDEVEIFNQVAQFAIRQLLKSAVNESLLLRDRLTHLLNERAAERYLFPDDRFAMLYQITYIDLDDFKQYNDTHGHDFGDEVLRRFGHFLQEHTRADDKAFRFHGDEFVIAWAGSQEIDVDARLEQLRESFAAERLIAGNHQVVTGVTFSYGTTRAADYAGYTAAKNAADKLMYDQKEQRKANKK